jgi:hypothetical protein
LGFRRHCACQLDDKSYSTQRLGLALVIASEPSRERDPVLAMVASRVVQPDTKLGASRRWHCLSPAEDFGVTEASEDERESLLQATEVLLGALKTRVEVSRLNGQDKIGLRVGKIINRHKVAKHFELRIGQAPLACCPRR